MKSYIKIFLLIILSFFLFQTCSKDNPTGPEENIPLAQLDTIINVDSKDATITFKDSVTIFIPQGAVSGNTKLVITKLAKSSIPNDLEMEFPNAYEISLGDKHIFEKPLEITFKYDPKKLNEGKLKYKIGAAYYNEVLNKWALFNNTTVDTLNNSITFSTNHLTKLSWWHFKYAYGYTDYLTSPHFIIYWVDGKVPTDLAYKSSLTNHKGKDPHYIQDILYYLEKARAVYKKNDLTVPSDTSSKAEVRVLELPKGVDGETSFFGFIRLNQNIKGDSYLSQEETVKITCAHELLHYVQDYYYLWAGAGKYIKWWLEATAVQADRIVWSNKTKFEAIYYSDEQLQTQLHRAWDDCNEDPNYYIAGGFLTYLTTYRNGAKLSIPKIIIETGKATNVHYFRTILNTYLRKNLSSYGIAHEYKDYIKWAYEHKGPIKIKYTHPLRTNNPEYVVPIRLTETNPSWTGTVAVSNLAIKMVKILVPSSMTKSTIRIILNSQDTQIEQFVYISDKNKTTFNKYLIKKDTMKIILSNYYQWIDILSTNVFKDDIGSFNLSVDLIQAPTITSITPASASVGEVVKITGNNFGTNQNSGDIWFGTIKALASDIVSWVNTQIEVKVPNGATTCDVHIKVDEEISNDVKFTVSGSPIITNIFDHLYNSNHQKKHYFTLPNNEVDIIGQNFGHYPPTRKAYVNNVETTISSWSDTLVRVKLPEAPTGNISIKLESSTGVSNEFPYFSGLPVSYLNSAETIELNTGFHIKYFNARGNMNSTNYVNIQPNKLDKSKYNWSNRVMTVDLNSIDNINGSIKYTFSEDGLNIKNVELDYTKSNQWPNEIVKYIGNNFPYNKTNDWQGFDSTFYSFGTCGENLEQSTTTINGSLNYVDDLRANFIGINYSAGCSFNSIYLKLNFNN